ncbi:ligase-associated DNA damage response endonuclease PdeM [Paraburkholderia sp. MM5482-R1]|uniref:ligase-associated DNA damage response endonuclease PdeM n=1 Tax=unclassified Paraburkholderia TaxID=2615204 RepID=UPI003D21B2B5
MKPTPLAIDVGGRPLVLSSLRACFDPALRARGIPVPTGSTAENLLRIERLITEFEPATLVFLGDLLHARESLSTLTLDALHAWCARHASRRVVLVEGNHDRHAGALPLTLDVESVREPWHIGAWALCQRPHAVDHAYVLAGHVHPVFRIATRTDSVRVPCFRFGIDRGVLPAFGSFTGGARETGRVLGERVFLVVQQRVIELRS